MLTAFLLGFGGSIGFALSSAQLAFAHVCNQLDSSTLAVDLRTERFLEVLANVLKEKKKS